MRIATLAKAFDVTTETVRRDLDDLAENGALKRTYGGGARRSMTDEPGIGVRSRTHAAERGLIARTAAGMVETGDALMIDCGSTTRLFAQMLAAVELRLTVVTNCLPVARALGATSHCRTILCCGDYVAGEDGVFGPEAGDFIRRFKANKAFIGAGGVTPDGLTDADSSGCSIKRAMMERSDRTILLVDSSKFDVVQFERVCPLSDIDAMVSEAAPPKRLAGHLGSAGVRVVVAAE